MNSCSQETPARVGFAWGGTQVETLARGFPDSEAGRSWTQIHRNLNPSAGPSWRPSPATQCLWKAQQAHKAGWTRGGAWMPLPQPLCFVFSLSGSGEKCIILATFTSGSFLDSAWPCPGEVEPAPECGHHTATPSPPPRDSHLGKTEDHRREQWGRS